MLTVPPVFISRNILYTAVTRAKKMVLIIGDKNMVYKMSQSRSSVVRHTGLSYELKEK
jgi:exodeoxyribonuclease V alpha subunit